MAKLLQAPPSDHHECAMIKLELIGDLGGRRQMFGDGAMELVGGALASANQLVNNFERGLTASPSRPLSKVDMHYYANVVIRARIQKMLDADVTDGRLDALAEWAVFRGVTVDQHALPGCAAPLVHANYRRLHQQLSDETTRGRPRASEVPSSRQAGQNGKTHKITNRFLAMQAEIGLAMEKAIERDNPNSVWAALTTLAQAQTGAMIGLSSDGIQYKGKEYQDSGRPDVFTIRHLRARMARAKARKNS